MREQPTLLSTCAGIPCGVVVDSLLVVPPWQGSAHTCPSDLDYYGYTDMEWHLVDRKGYPAPWLERKLTPSICERIEHEILTHHKAN